MNRYILYRSGELPNYAGKIYAAKVKSEHLGTGPYGETHGTYFVNEKADMVASVWSDQLCWMVER